MDPSAQVLSEEARKTLYNELTDLMLSAMEKGEMLYEEAIESGKSILRLDHITTQPELLAFLEELSQRWKIYQPAYIKAKGQQQQTSDQSTIADLEQNLNQIVNS